MRRRPASVVTALIVVVSGCAETTPTATNPRLLGDHVPLAAYGTVVRVRDANELYDALNNTAYIGATVLLAAGNYALDPTRPNNGRLELQADMSLMGEGGDPTKVVIDASALPASSYLRPDGQQTGAIRQRYDRIILSLLRSAQAAELTLHVSENLHHIVAGAGVGEG